MLALYVIAETYSDQPIAEMISKSLLQQALAVGALLIVAGIIARVFDKGKSAVTKNRCRVCRTPIPYGAIYCRAHLRNILHEEDDKTHASRIRR